MRHVILHAIANANAILRHYIWCASFDERLADNLQQNDHKQRME